MGNYTALIATIELNEEGKLVVPDYLKSREWKLLGERHPDLRFLKLPRRNMIAFGGSAYFDDVPYYTMHENRRDVNDGVWKFRCSFKNYDKEIETFKDEVIPIIAKRVLKWRVLGPR